MRSIETEGAILHQNHQATRQGKRQEWPEVHCNDILYFYLNILRISCIHLIQAAMTIVIVTMR